MKNTFVKSNYSFSYSPKGIFIIDNTSLKKTKVSFSIFNKVVTIKGKFLKTNFAIKSGVDTQVILHHGPRIRRHTSSERVIYLDNKKIGKLTRDLELIQGLNAVVGIPTVLKMNNYKVIYFRPYVRKIDIYNKGELLGYTKKSKDQYDLFTKDEETLPLLLVMSLATIDSCFL